MRYQTKKALWKRNQSGQCCQRRTPAYRTTPSHAVMLLEFQSCPSVNLQEAFQQKRRALIQRSARRVEEIQAKTSEAKANSRAQSETTETRANTTTRAQSDPTTVQSSTTKPRRDGRSAESTHAGVDSKQKKQQPKLQTPLQPPMLAKLKKVGEVRIRTPEMRIQDVADMRQRTERLYSRLDEVKLQEEVRSRQEAHAKNREKAKEFHKKLRPSSLRNDTEYQFYLLSCVLCLHLFCTCMCFCTV